MNTDSSTGASSGAVATHRILISRLLVLAFILVLVLTRPLQAGRPAGALMLALGLVLVGICVVGRLWCATYIAGYKDAALVTAGPYSLCRHPLYLCSLLGFAGVALTTQSLVLSLGVTMVVLMSYPSVMRREEAFLRARFGPAFDAYCARTPRLLPSTAHWHEPESYTIQPRLFRRAMRDVVWFVWAVALVVLVRAAQEHWPAPFSIW